MGTFHAVLLSFALALTALPAAATTAAPEWTDAAGAEARARELLAGPPSAAVAAAAALAGAGAPAERADFTLEEALEALAAARGETVPLDAAAALREAGVVGPAGDAVARLLGASAIATHLAADGAYAEAATLLTEAAEDAADALGPMPMGATTIGNLLRIADGASDTWTTNVVVHIDQGGNDVYVNTASAGASLNHGFPVMVVLELAGHERYTASGSSGVVVAQGGGYLGVGVLVDAGGNDVYEAYGTNNPNCSPSGAGSVTVAAQGGGFTGAGVLVDLDGMDSYTADARSCGGSATTVAQGGGFLGAGALVDVGLVALNRVVGDTYSAYATSTLLAISASTSVVGPAIVAAQGGGNLGGGVLVEGIGGDSMHATATGGVANTAAQGGGILGGGVLVDGEGSDYRNARAEGVLDLVLSGFYASVSVGVNNGATTVAAQGGASIGVGALVDLLGNDVNVAYSRSYTRAGAETTYSAGRATAAATSGGARAAAQGGADLGAAVHVDATGFDQYDARAVAETYGFANAPSASLASVSVTCGPARLVARGGGAVGGGIFADGLNSDAYSGEATQKCSATRNGVAMPVNNPSPNAVVHEGQGALGAGIFADADGADSRSGPASSYTAFGCWTNSPPNQDANVGFGVNLNGGIGVPTSCIPPPN